MSARAPAPWLLVALVLPLACALPALTMGYTREDWLFLWAAQDPATAPAGATGAFPRPLALLLWKLAVAGGGAAPGAMHLLMLLLAVAWAAAVALLVAAACDGPSRPRRTWLAPSLAAAFVGSHAALVEVRLWASASNGLLAATLATWGLVLLASRRAARPRWRGVVGWTLILGAGLARADAWAFLLLVPALRAGGAAPRPAAARPWRAELAAAALGGAALVWMLRAGGGWGWHPANAGHLARRLVVPWGPAVSAGLASVLGPGALVLLAAAALRARGIARGISLSILAVLGASMVAPWAPAGRYLVVPVTAVAIAVGVAVDRWRRRERAPEPAAPRRAGALGPIAPRAALVLVGGWLGLNAASCGWGTTTRDLHRRAHAETRLFQAVARHGTPAVDRIFLLDAPAMGWRSEERDAENVVSCALHRPVAITLKTDSDRGGTSEAPGGIAEAGASTLVLRFRADGVWEIPPSPSDAGRARSRGRER